MKVWRLPLDLCLQIEPEQEALKETSLELIVSTDELKGLTETLYSKHRFPSLPVYRRCVSLCLKMEGIDTPLGSSTRVFLPEV